MKTSPWKSCLLAVVACSMLLGGAKHAFAADENPPGPERLQRLERRINEIADRQEQMMRRLAASQQRDGAMPAPDPENFRPPAQPMGPGHPLAEKDRRSIHDAIGLIIFCCIICNILLAIWIFTDIRKRGEGSGIFIVLALVAGVPAAIIYSLVRIGDKVSVAGK